MAEKIPNYAYIYTLPDELLEKILDDYTDYVVNPKSELRQTDDYWMEMMSCTEQPTPPQRQSRALRYKYNPFMPNDEEVRVENLPKPQRNPLRAHIICLLDILYRRTVLSFDKTIYSAILRGAFHEYAYALNVLRDNRIIEGSTRTGIDIVRPELFKCVKTTNSAIIRLIEKVKKEAKKDWINKMKIASELTSKTFIERYNSGLSSFVLTDINGAKAEIPQNCDKPKKELSFKYYFSELCRDGNEFTSKLKNYPDINGRWYHRVVNAPSVFRNYSNIHFTIDASNSHLVLFNYFLLNYYLNKDINIFTTFSEYNYKVLSFHLKDYLKEKNSSLSPHLLQNNTQWNTHSELYFKILDIIKNLETREVSTLPHMDTFFYFCDKFCKQLEISGFQNEILGELKEIKADVILFIYLSSNGLLWEYFAEKWGLSRKEIKKQAFGEIFYSHLHSKTQNPFIKNSFKKDFPTVYKILCYYKRIFSKQCKEAALIKEIDGNKQELLQLPHKLTQLESSIFYDILRGLYYRSKTVRAFGIHDAVAVLNDAVPEAEVVEIMRGVYRKYGLVASFKIEH